jgi:hypothetical protein
MLFLALAENSMPLTAAKEANPWHVIPAVAKAAHPPCKRRGKGVEGSPLGTGSSLGIFHVDR